jgi:hypothetical protein
MLRRHMTDPRSTERAMRMTRTLAQRLIACGYASLALCLLALVLVLIHGYGDADGGALRGMAADAIDSTTLRSIAGLGVLGCLLAAAGHGILERLRSASAQISDDHQQP